MIETAIPLLVVLAHVILLAWLWSRMIDADLERRPPPRAPQIPDRPFVRAPIVRRAPLPRAIMLPASARRGPLVLGATPAARLRATPLADRAGSSAPLGVP